MEELEIADGPRIVTGPVGIGDAEREATYVLADVTNNGGGDAVVTVAGEIVGKDGTSAGLRAEALRIPAGETRLFALVTLDVVVVDATSGTARVLVKSAVRTKTPAAVVTTGVQQHDDQSRSVVAGFVENQTDRSVTAVVIGAFYDESGRPVMRRTTVYKLDAGGRRSAQFVGPRGSKRGALFIGDVGR